MNRIDFLPARYREARAARQSRWWGGAVIVAFGGLVGAAFVGQKVVQYRTRQEIATAEIDFNAAKLAQQKLDLAQKQARDVNVEAELFTYLRHPWPRTQVLRRITAILPQEVTLERLRIGRDENKPKDQLTLGVIKPTEPSKPTVDTSTPAEKDLKRLREECDARRVVVELTGYTSDLTALHVYLNELARETLFAQAELTSIQSVEKASSRRSQFTARLVLAPGYGQRNANESPSNQAKPQGSPAGAPSSVTLQSSPLAPCGRGEIASAIGVRGGSGADSVLVANGYPTAIRSPGEQLSLLATLSRKGRGINCNAHSLFTKAS